MKSILLIIAALCLAVSAYAATLPRDGEGQKVQAPSWDATLSQSILTTASQNITISARIWYEFTAATDCKARLMNTTTKATWPAFSLYAKQSFRGSNASNTASAKAIYLNVSGCTGDFRAQ